MQDHAVGRVDMFGDGKTWLNAYCSVGMTHVEVRATVGMFDFVPRFSADLWVTLQNDDIIEAEVLN